MFTVPRICTSLLAESFKIVHVKNHILLKCKGVEYEYFLLKRSGRGTFSVKGMGVRIIKDAGPVKLSSCISVHDVLFFP